MRFLCLHGFGTNNQIFKLQTAALRYELTNHDDHVFQFVQGVLLVDKPVELGSMSDFEEGYLGYFDPKTPASALTALCHLDAFIASHGPFEGVIGFSQGAQLAATYIIHKRLENPTADPIFECAILFSPLSVYDPREWIASGKVRKMDVTTDGRAIAIPSLVVWGEEDQWKEDSEGVSKLCDPETSYTFVHSGAHEIPGIRVKDAVEPIAKLAKRCIFNCTR